ncbi:MAG: bifunctional DNA-formamidopyrimidine glycosylase/DNA-(apurinic or apyrimidinic site) lyase [Candidatus Eisenbacteria bacterium]|nr:bifunctional DNA-formamidopyrimidine glycosylase/DNA-(apurinic or apyrimidinic site) lyase [Candidatus Eisenbacteria bacterium]
MPELPEVETYCRRLRGCAPQHPTLLRREIRAAHLVWPGVVAEPAPGVFRRRIAGQRVRDVSRRGKFLQLRLSHDLLLMHLRMSGSLRLARDGDPLPPHTRIWLQLGRGWRLVFRDPRKFGRVWLTADPIPTLGQLGPEPLAADFGARDLQARLRRHRRQLKPLLLDQRFLAGIGNIYADEALHRARLHPQQRSDELAPDAAQRLWRSIRAVLRSAIRCNGTSFDGVYGGGGFLARLRVYRRTGQPCRRCGAPIQRIVVAQRGTHVCPHCQPPPGI